MSGARRVCVVVLVTSLSAVAWTRARADEPMYNSGQPVMPSFEGWEQNADGTLNMVFGYLNRNYQEHVEVPIGPDNHLSPGAADQGQPTHFLPRRNRFVFRVKAPKDFGGKEIVWTLTTHGKTVKAYATTKPDYAINNRVLMLNNRSITAGHPYMDVNKAPEVSVVGPTRLKARVGEPVALTAIATDDGIPKVRPATPLFSGAPGAHGFRVAWFVYRGAGPVTFDPEQFNVWVDFRPGTNTPWTPGWVPPTPPADGRFPVKATFSEPGTYVLRVMAHDGGLDAVRDVTVDVAAR